MYLANEADSNYIAATQALLRTLTRILYTAEILTVFALERDGKRRFWLPHSAVSMTSTRHRGGRCRR